MLSAFTFLGCVPRENARGGDTAETDVQTPDQAGTAEASNYAEGSWITDYSQALASAANLNRHVLINFTGSDWCSWCFKLRDEVFTQPAFIDYAKANFVLLTVDFPRRTKLPASQQKANQALAESFGVQGFPTIVLVDSQGKEITRTGYQYGGAENYVKHLKELLGEN